MAALDQPRTDDDPAYNVARRRELEQARIKLLALAGALPGALADVELRYRLTETAQERMTLLRVWDGARQHPGETVACLRLPEGWRFTSYPDGRVLADADGIAEPGDAQAAARVIATHVAEPPQDRSPR